MAATTLEVARDIVVAWAGGPNGAKLGLEGPDVGKYIGKVFKEVVNAVLEAGDEAHKPRH